MRKYALSYRSCFALLMILNYEDKNRVNFNLGVDCREGFGNKRGCGGGVSPHTTNGNLDNSIYWCFFDFQIIPNPQPSKLTTGEKKSVKIYFDFALHRRSDRRWLRCTEPVECELVEAPRSITAQLPSKLIPNPSHTMKKLRILRIHFKQFSKRQNIIVYRSGCWIGVCSPQLI